MCRSFLKEGRMSWNKPKIVEVSLASEINCYACAEIG
ncbi:MAG: pyrroloquinoline quinone precursor peptide PqqA [Acetobacteraceae bacterium]